MSREAGKIIVDEEWIRGEFQLTKESILVLQNRFSIEDDLRGHPRQSR